MLILICVLPLREALPLNFLTTYNNVFPSASACLDYLPERLPQSATLTLLFRLILLDSLYKFI